MWQGARAHVALGLQTSLTPSFGPLPSADRFNRPFFLHSLVPEGFDLDEPSVQLANANIAAANIAAANIAAAGLADRLTVRHQDAADADLAGECDLVCALECIHDLPDPVGVLATMRRLVKPGGTVLVMHEGVAPQFGAVGDLMERLFYGFSLMVCLPDGMSAEGSAGTGTVMRPSTLERYARETGFAGMTVLPLEHDMFRFYRLEV